MLTLSSQLILGCRIDTTSYSDACDRIQDWIERNHACYIVAANVHVVMTAYWDKAYCEVINKAALVTPDGMPLVWGLRLLGQKTQQRVYGPDLMLAWCDRAARLGLPIYLYGSTDETLTRLETQLTSKFENLTIAGSYAPPYIAIGSKRVSGQGENRGDYGSSLRLCRKEDIDRMQISGAKVVFVALGCPKQEFWMAEALGKLNMVAIGVGAAFDFHSGAVSQAPRWIMRLGLEWLYRLTQEPKRLWRRYLINNPAFVILFALQLLRDKQ